MKKLCHGSFIANNCIYIHTHIYTQNRLPGEVVGNYYKTRISKVLFLTGLFVTLSLFFSKTQLDHTHY